MEQWYCFKCKEKVVENDISTSYLEITGFIQGLQCPKCGVAYLTEESAVWASEREEEIEAKLG